MDAPKWVHDAPDIPLGSEWVYGAFWDLHTCRSSGFGAGQIPWSAIRDYANCFGLDDDAFEDLAALIRAMDNEYLEYNREQAKKK